MIRSIRRGTGGLPAWPGLLSLAAVLAVCWTACPPSPGPEERPRPPAPGAEQRFSKLGLAVPETHMTLAAGNTGQLDLGQIREAIAEARVLSPAEVERIEHSTSAKAEEDRATRTATTGAEPPRPRSPAPAAAPPPPGRERAAPQKIAELAPQEAAGPVGAKDEMAPRKKAAGERQPETAGKTVLKRVAAAPRQAKVLVRDEDGKLAPLATREIRVVTYLQGPRARTVVDTVFENRSAHRLQGTFYFPLPAEASPVGFAMFSGAVPLEAERLFANGRSLPDLPADSSAQDDMRAFAPGGPAGRRGPDWQVRQEARVVEQKRARQVYEEVVRRSVDPALLEWSGGNNFSARVFPIEPHSLKRVVLVYEQTLAFDGSLLRYTFPLPEQKLPRPMTARVHVDQSLGRVRAVTMSTDLRAVAPRGRALGPWTVWDLVQEEPGGALSVAVEPTAAEAQVIAGPDPGGLAGRTFYARLLPKVPGGVLQSTGRALLLVDTSLSAEDNGAHELQAGMLEALLQGDDSIREYAVLLFDVRPRWLQAPGWRANTPANRQATLAELRKIYLEGATNFDAVLADLDANLDWLAPDGRPPAAFLLSDGQLTWGLTDPAALIARHPAAGRLRWICYRFGENAANQALFDELTRETAGRTVTVLSAAEIPAAAEAHRQAAARIEGLEVDNMQGEGAGAGDLVLAGDPKLLFPGQQLQVAGRLLAAGPARIRVRASLAGKPLVVEAAIPAEAAHRLAPRAFGELFTRRLLALDDERLDRMIVALSQHYLLANERASLLILEDQAAYERYAIADERVDLSDLEQLRRREEDQRLLEAQGLDLDRASPLARELVGGLEALAGRLTPPLRAQPLVESPYAGGPERLEAERSYRQARAADKLDVMVYDAVARARALAGDTMGAVRALSCNVELRPRDTEATRLTGYGLLALGQYEPAAELFERGRLLRPFEAQAYLEEALALDGAGRIGQAVRRYEIVLSRDWPRHDAEVKTVAAFHLARLLAMVQRAPAVPAGLKETIDRRLTELAAVTGREPIDYQFTTHWSTDGIDIDLWVIEPDGTKCFYGHRQTALGGELHWDITDGLGPELYHMKKAAPGEYLVAVHYYGNNSQRLSVPTALLLVADRKVFGPEDRYTRRIQMRMLPKRDAVLELRRERL